MKFVFMALVFVANCSFAQEPPKKTPVLDPELEEILKLHGGRTPTTPTAPHRPAAAAGDVAVQVWGVREDMGKRAIVWRDIGDGKHADLTTLREKNECVRKMLDGIRNEARGPVVRDRIETMKNAMLDIATPMVRFEILIIDPKQEKTAPKAHGACPGFDIAVQASVFLKTNEGAYIQSDAAGIVDLSGTAPLEERLANAGEEALKRALAVLAKRSPKDAEGIGARYAISRDYAAEKAAGIRLDAIKDPDKLAARDAALEWLTGPGGPNLPKTMVQKLVLDGLEAGALTTDSLTDLKAKYAELVGARSLERDERRNVLDLAADLTRASSPRTPLGRAFAGLPNLPPKLDGLTKAIYPSSKRWDTFVKTASELSEIAGGWKETDRLAIDRFVGRLKEVPEKLDHEDLCDETVQVTRALVRANPALQANVAASIWQLDPWWTRRMIMKGMFKIESPKVALDLKPLPNDFKEMSVTNHGSERLRYTLREELAQPHPGSKPYEASYIEGYLNPGERKIIKTNATWASRFALVDTRKIATGELPAQFQRPTTPAAEHVALIHLEGRRDLLYVNNGPGTVKIMVNAEITRDGRKSERKLQAVLKPYGELSTESLQQASTDSDTTYRYTLTAVEYVDK